MRVAAGFLCLALVFAQGGAGVLTVLARKAGRMGGRVEALGFFENSGFGGWDCGGMAEGDGVDEAELELSGLESKGRVLR